MTVVAVSVTWVWDGEGWKCPTCGQVMPPNDLWDEDDWARACLCPVARMPELVGRRVELVQYGGREAFMPIGPWVGDPEREKMMRLR